MEWNPQPPDYSENHSATVLLSGRRRRNILREKAGSLACVLERELRVLENEFIESRAERRPAADPDKPGRSRRPSRLVTEPATPSGPRSAAIISRRLARSAEPSPWELLRMLRAVVKETLPLLAS